MVIGGQLPASSRRTVLKPSQSSVNLLKVTMSRILSTESPSYSTPVSTDNASRENTNLFSRSTSRSVSSQHSTTTCLSKKMEQTQSLNKLGSSQKQQFIWVNEKIFANAKACLTGSERTRVESAKHSSSELDGKESPTYIRKSKYKLTKVSSAEASTGAQTSGTADQSSSTPGTLDQGSSTSGPAGQGSSTSLIPLGRYKLVARASGSQLGSKLRNSPFRSRTKIKLPGRPSPYIVSGRPSPYISRSGKRIISRYKIRRRSTEQKLNQMSRPKNRTNFGASPVLKSSQKMQSSLYKVDHRVNTVVRSKYKIDRVKGSRKPSRITRMKRTPKDRRSYRWVKCGLEYSGRQRNTFVSPYRLCRPSTSISGELSL